jgi:hypothetical protein
MAWRVSWAALCTALICESPTMKIMAEPINRQTKPDLTRVVTPDVAEIVLVVMSPSVRPIEMKRYCFTCLSGRSPDLQFQDLNAFPVTQWHMLKSNRSQLRGQSRFWPHLGGPHRVPYYASGRLTSKHRTPTTWQGKSLLVNTKATNRDWKRILNWC